MLTIYFFAHTLDSSGNDAIVPIKLEQMVKQFKTHRCAMDFDHGFCKTIFKEED